MVVVIVMLAASGFYLVTNHYLSSMKRIHRLTNPLQASSVLRALTGAVSVDNTLSNGQITSLALSLRKLSLSSVVFGTVPNVGTGTAGSQSVVQLNRSLDPGFWHAFEYDALPACMKSHGMKRLGSTTQ